MSSKKGKSSCPFPSSKKAQQWKKSRDKVSNTFDQISFWRQRFLPQAGENACTGRGRRLTFSKHYFLGVWLCFCHLFSHILCNHSLYTGRRPQKCIFLCISKRTFPWVKCTFWVSFRWVFNVFHLNLERMLPDNQTKKLCQGIFNFCFFQKLWAF